MDNWQLYIVLLFPIAGLALTVFGVRYLRRTIKRSNEWERLKVQVQGLGERTSSEGTTLYYPKYEYEMKGIKYQGKGSVASASPQYKVGSEIMIMTNPLNPSESDVINRTLILMSAIPLIMGVLILLVGSVCSYFVLSLLKTK